MIVIIVSKIMGRLIIGDLMKKKKKRKDNQKILLIIIIFLLLFSYFEITGNVRVGNMLNDILYIPFFDIDSNNVSIEYNKELKEENKELKEILNINYSLTDFDMINATVIERNSTFWLNELTINKGSLDGIEKGLCVITSNGFIGEVLFTSLKTSKVKLITDNSFQISVMVNNKNKILSIINNQLVIRGINNKDNIKEGNIVLTSGLQDKYPKGIVIGTITNIESESNNVGLIAFVSLQSNIDNLRFVTVLKRNKK